MSTPLTNIHPISLAAPQTVRISSPRPEAGGGEAAAKVPNQDSPFGPDYIVETKKSSPSRSLPEGVQPSEALPDRPAKPSVAGVVPFAASSGPAADLAALPPLEAIGAEALTELSLSKLMQPSHRRGDPQ